MGILKVDEQGRRLDVHSLRVSFATHLSKAGVPPRTAHAAMRHSDIRLTTVVYSDESVRPVAEAVEALSGLPMLAARLERADGSGVLVPVLVRKTDCLVQTLAQVDTADLARAAVGGDRPFMEKPDSPNDSAEDREPDDDVGAVAA